MDVSVKDTSTAGILVHEMVNGQRVMAVFKNMREANGAYSEACRYCDEHAINYRSRKTNWRTYIESDDGSIWFTSERSDCRGASCDTFYLDPRAEFREWMAPIAMLAQQRFNC